MEYIAGGAFCFVIVVVLGWIEIVAHLKQNEFRIRALERLNDKQEKITHVYHHPPTPPKGKGVHALLEQATHLRPSS